MRAPAVTVDTPEFKERVEAWAGKYHSAIPMVRDGWKDAWSALIAHIDAHAAAVAAKAVADERERVKAQMMHLTFERDSARQAMQSMVSAPQQHAQAVHQFRTAGAADWYDGHPDREDGGGPYEVRTLYKQQHAQAAQSSSTATPEYPKGEVVGPCVCGSWPGGECLKCQQMAARAGGAHG